MSAVFSDGTRERFVFDCDVPVVGIEIGPTVPLMDSNAQTQGPRDCYVETKEMVLDEKKFLRRYGAKPPIAQRRKTARLDRLKDYIPKVGDTVGFIGGDSLSYEGVVEPIESLKLKVHVFRLREQMYVSLSSAMELLDNGGKPLISQSRDYLRQKLGRTRTSFRIESRTDALYGQTNIYSV